MRGFTLLEVLVALVIVALGMSALLEMLSQSASNISALRDKTVAEWIAMNQIALARLSLNAPNTGTTQGDVQNCGNGNWHWQQQVSAVDAIPGLLAITVSVQRTGTAAANASQAHPAQPPGATPGAIGSLGPNVALGPTAALGSVSSLSGAGCAGVIAPGGSLGNGASPGLGSTDAASISGSVAAGLGGNPSADSASSGNGGSGAQASWLVTITGFRGNSLAAASGESPDWTGSGFSTDSNGGATSSPVAPGVSPGLQGRVTP